MTPLLLRGLMKRKARTRDHLPLRTPCSARTWTNHTWLRSSFLVKVPRLVQLRPMWMWRRRFLVAATRIW